MENSIQWSIDHAHTDISFKVRHLMIAHVSGTFKSFDATIFTIGKDFSTAEIDLWIDVDSLNTGDVKRDMHLNGEDFFNSHRFKQINFSSNSIGMPDEDGNCELWGELTIKGIKKNVRLNVQFGGMINDPYGFEKAGFSISGTILRSDWGLTWNANLENGGYLLSDEIKISCEVELTSSIQKDLTMVLEASATRSGAL